MNLDNKDILKSQPAPQGEGLCRWVKATKDNLPYTEEPLVIRYIESGHKARCKFMHANDLVWHLETMPFDVYEYLEPLPSQPTGDVSILLDALESIGKKMIVNEGDGTSMFPVLLKEAKERVITARKALSSYQSSLKK